MALIWHLQFVYHRSIAELYNRLPPICKKLGIEQPEFYLSMDPNPNAWTFGDTKIL